MAAFSHNHPGAAWVVLKILEEVTGIDPLYPTDDLLIDSDLPRRFPPDFARMHNLLLFFYDAQGVHVDGNLFGER